MFTVFPTTNPRNSVVQVAQNYLVHHRGRFAFLTQQNVRAFFRLYFEHDAVSVLRR